LRHFTRLYAGIYSGQVDSNLTNTAMDYETNASIIAQNQDTSSIGIYISKLEGERDKLREEVESLRSNQTTLMVTCRSLAQEIEKRDQAKKRKGSKSSDRSTPSPPHSRSPDGSPHLFERCSLLEKALDEANQSRAAEKLRHEQQMEELTQRLQTTELSKHSSDPKQHQESLDRLLQAYKKKVAVAEEKQAEAERELALLRHQNFSYTSPSTSSASNESERITALQAQLQVYVDDFKSERHDREVAQGRCAQLEQELSLLKTQLNAFQESAMTRLHSNRMASLSNLQNEYAARHRVQQSYDVLPFRARGFGGAAIECDSEDVATGDEDIIDSLSTPTAPRGGSRVGRVVADSEGGDAPAESIMEDSMLQCPKCNRGYQADDHVLFLEHIDQCVSCS